MVLIQFQILSSFMEFHFEIIWQEKYKTKKVELDD